MTTGQSPIGNRKYMYKVKTILVGALPEELETILNKKFIDKEIVSITFVGFNNSCQRIYTIIYKE